MSGLVVMSAISSGMCKLGKEYLSVCVCVCVLGGGGGGDARSPCDIICIMKFFPVLSFVEL